MSKHTHGPWVAKPVVRFPDPENGMHQVFDGASVHSQDGMLVYLPAKMPGVTVSNADAVTIANARLIAAAPELLEFAEEVRRNGDTRLASMAIAVINKATGETK